MSAAQDGDERARATGRSPGTPGLPAPRRALVVSLRFLGDALLSTPLAHALRRRWPDCSVDMLVFAGTEGMFEGNGDVSQVIAVPERTSAADMLRRLRSLWRRYDLAVIAQTGTRPFVFGWAAGRYRVGLVSTERGKSWWKQALLHRHAPFDMRGARVLENQRIAELVGCEGVPQVVAPTAGWNADDLARELGFDARERYAVVHPSPRWRYKQWPREGWHALLRSLVVQGMRVVVTGGPGEAERAYLDALFGNAGLQGVQRRDGRWSLAQTADVLRRAALYVGVDTATTHLAAACGTPTVALFGPTDPGIWGPWPAHDGAPYERAASRQRRGNVLLLQNAAFACVPCQLEGCERRRDSRSLCLEQLPSARVTAAALEMARSA